MAQDTHYHRQPGISPIRIAVYPKRRLSDIPSGLRTIPTEKPIELPKDYSVAYVDFFRHGADDRMASFSHIVDQPVEVALDDVDFDERPLAGEARGA